MCTHGGLDEVGGEGGLVAAHPVSHVVDDDGDALYDSHGQHQPEQSPVPLHVEVETQAKVFEFFRVYE